MDFTQVPTVVAIMVITYLIGYASKQIPQVKDNVIPIIVGCLLYTSPSPRD